MHIVILSRSLQIYTTYRLAEAARRRGHDPFVINHSKCSVIMERNAPSVHFEGMAIEEVDAVIPRIGASVTFYGTAVVRQFEMMKVFVANTSEAILKSRDKLRSLQILSTQGVNFPKTAFAKFPKNEDLDDLIRQVGGAPLIIKLLEGTQGLGVVLAETKKAAKSVIEAFSGLKENILVQEFIKESGGADVRALVIGDRVVAAMKRQGMEGEFRSNLHRGGSGEKVDLSPEEEATAVKAARAMGLSIAGVDMLRSDRGPLVIEVNSSPGLKGLETVTGIDVADLMIQFVEQRVREKETTPYHH